MRFSLLGKLAVTAGILVLAFSAAHAQSLNPGVVNLPVNTTVKIFTVSGHQVKTLTTGGGSVAWDLSNESGDKAASGIYIYLITTGDGQKRKGKVAVIK